MRVTNQRSRFAKAALCSAITLALIGCGDESLKENIITDPPGGEDSGDSVTVSVSPDYKLELLSGEHLSFGGAVTEVNAINPDSVAPASSLVVKPLGTVIKTTKPTTAEIWAGTTLPDSKTLELSEKRSQITMWVYSSAVDIPVLFKVENANNANEFVEAEVRTTKANEWEQLTFDFTQPKGGELNPSFVFNKKSVFFDFGNSGVDRVVYWDNVRHEGYGLLDQPQPKNYPVSDSGKPLLGNPEYQAISYGAWRERARTDGDTVPSVAQHLEDMKILSAMGIKMVRTYNTQGFKGTDGQSNTENLLAAIRLLKDQAEADGKSFEMYVMLGVWIDALNSWTGNPIDSSVDSPNNALEIAKAKELALKYPDIVKVVAVGNEAMVDWASSYKVHPSIILDHVNDLQSWKQAHESIQNLWITTSDNWAVWAGIDANGNQNEQSDLKALIQAVDYVSLHTYAFHDTKWHPELSEEWKVSEQDQGLTKEEQIATAMDKAYVHSLEQYAAAQQFIHDVDPSKPIHIGETGWSTFSNEAYGDDGTQAADEYKQKLFYDDMRDFSNNSGVSLFFFQAFDEPWKGDAANNGHSEQHFGLIDIDCHVKYTAWDKVKTLNELGLTRDCAFSASYGGVLETLLADVQPPPFAPVEQPPLEGEFKVLGASLFSGASAIAWEGTSWAGIDDDGVLTVATLPDSAKDWGWGAHIGDDTVRDFSNIKTLKFDIRSYTEGGKPLAEFGFGIGFQSDTGGEWASNHTIRFNEGGRQLTTEWQTVDVDISEFSGAPDLTKIAQPFVVHNTTNSGLTESEIQIRNISWFE
ncbi:exo-beta-1,3-glucanase (GH17 family) [Vibrio sp. ES.051]|uniref:hypothetical protein n=1 Tax=Vibrio sp. ES.051 TaxID=1761909 RepID=UPI000BF82D4D|nr:hypothetical protein [Vibrio sp. ES.051]PFG58600.1 exo-beta-1,3-glucanase (GH17 family) [Vibrio sp. ES.051]